MINKCNFSIGSLNARGLGQVEKRNDVFTWLKAKKLSIYCVLDFHCKSSLYNQYSKEWGSECVFSEGTGDSRGIAVMFSKDLEYKILHKDIDTEGNYIILDLQVFDHRFTLVAVYGPNKDKPNFYLSLKEKVEAMENSSIIMCADWNVVMNYELDTRGYKHCNNPKSRESLIQLMESLEMYDVWRERNEDNKKFTWFNKKQMARLDYFLITSDWMTRVLQTRISPGYRTDHSLITLKLNIGNMSRGRGFWKFNSSLLQDKDYVDIVKNVIKETVEKYSINVNSSNNNCNFDVDDQTFFEMLKLEIRGKTISYGAYKKRQNEAQELNLEREIEILHENICENNVDIAGCLDQLEEKKQQLEELRKIKMRAAMLRAKVKYYELGEKPTKFFFDLEKRNGEAKTFTHVNVNDNIVTDQDKILNAQRDFYKDLYSSKSTTGDENNIFLEDKFINKLNETQKNTCEGKISVEDVKSVLHSMSNNKSPGSDGYTVEFYKFFFSDLGTFLVNSLNYAFTSGKLSITQRLGVITCIPKPNKAREYIKNWRPISLLNVDYKILTGVLARRLKNVLEQIINEDQKGFLRNRCMSENCRFLYDTMFELEKRNKPGLLLIIDFEKAFDSINWTYLENVLEKYNFGIDFQRWFRILYNQASSVVTNGGHFSESFSLGRGCRQGDPLSPYLFLLAIEPLAMKLKLDSNIKGVKLGTKEHKLGQYADDLFLLQDGSKRSLEYTFDVFNSFENVSGLKVNVEKTNAAWLGSRLGSNDQVSNRVRLKFTDSFMLLGIRFNTNIIRGVIEII